MGVVQEIDFAMDQAAIEKLIAESTSAGERVGKNMATAIGTGGKDKARTVAVDIMGSLERELEKNEARVKEALARGLISPQGAQRAAAANGAAYNAGILKAMDQLRAKGALTNEAFVEMTNKLKNVGAASSEVDKTTNSFGRLNGILAKVGGILGGLFAFQRIKMFGEQSLEEWKKDEAALARLDVTLKRMGTSADDLAPQLRGLEGEMRKLRLDEDETQEILGTLIGRTNKVADSFKNVALVVALARREHMDFGSASQIVANLMNGNVIRLRQLGINATNAKDALVELRKETLGAGENWAQTLEGRLTGLNVQWGNFKSAIGQAMIEAGGGTSIIDTLSATIQTMTDWVMNNHEEIAHWKDAIVEVVMGLINMGKTLNDLSTSGGPQDGFIEGIHKMEDSLNKLNARMTIFAGGIKIAMGQAAAGFKMMAEGRAELDKIEAAAALRKHKGTPDAIEGLAGGDIGASGGIIAGPGGGGGRDALKDAAEAKRIAAELKKTHDETIANALKLIETESTRLTGLRLLREEETNLKKELEDTTLSLHDRIEALQKLNDVQAGLKKGASKLDPEFVKMMEGQIDRQMGITPPPKAGDAALSPEDEKRVRDSIKPIDMTAIIKPASARDAFDDMIGDMRESSADVANDIADNFSEAFDRMKQDGFTVNSILSNLGKGMAKSILGEIAKVAKGEAMQALANAIKFLAIGIGQAATGNPMSGKSFAAAATFGKSAIAWGLLAGGVGSIGGGGSSGSSGGGSSNSDRTSSVDNANKQAGNINIYLDGVDPRNQRHQELIGETQRRYAETTGGQIIYHEGGAPR